MEKFFLKYEKQLLMSILKNLSAEFLLHIEGASEFFKIYLTSSKKDVFQKEFNVRGKCDELPFKIDSIDTVLLSHVLEEHPNEFIILQQCYDCIVPEGYLIIAGFQPWSLLGIKKWFSAQGDWDAHFKSSYRVRSWLRKMGFVIVKQKKDAKLLAAYLNGVYIIVAKKRVLALKPSFELKSIVKSVRPPRRIATFNRIKHETESRNFH